MTKAQIKSLVKTINTAIDMRIESGKKFVDEFFDESNTARFVMDCTDANNHLSISLMDRSYYKAQQEDYLYNIEKFWLCGL